MCRSSRLAFASVAELLQGYANHRFAPADVINAMFQAPGSAAWVRRAYSRLDPGAIQQQAAAAHDLGADGRQLPLFGVSVAVKDNIERLGEPVGLGLIAPLAANAEADAQVVQLLRTAGALVLGATRMDALAYAPTGDTMPGVPIPNPWRANRMAGGSSGGSALAVAAGLATIAIGTDTGGSVRIPASLCGISGLKPTFNTISCDGVWPLARSLDHVGILGRSAEDIAYAFAVLAGSTDVAHLTAPASGDIKLGYIDQAITRTVMPDVRRAIDAAIDTFRELRMQVADVCINEIEAAPRLVHTIVSAEIHSVYAPLVAERPECFAQDLKAKIIAAGKVQDTEYAAAKQQQQILTHAVDRLFETVDALLLPTTPVTAPVLGQTAIQIGDRTRDPTAWLVRCTTPFNLTGHPAISIPCGFDSEGLPVGLQIVGRRNEDATVLRLASLFQRATGWHRRIEHLNLLTDAP